jgi:ubiquinone/menaquinone biosynthesis C-methylase UbiE
MAAPDWTTYDTVAETYGRLVAGNGYAALAADLVAALRLTSAAVVLDVGCGSGAAAAAAQARTGPAGLVVALDLSLCMVRSTAVTGGTPSVVGTATCLPFDAGRFDAVMANLVLSHLDAYDQALREMVRVSKPGGRVGVTAWAQGGSAGSSASHAWLELAQSFVGRNALDDALRRVLPNEGRLSEAEELSAAMRMAGVQDVQVQRREYRVAMPVSDYLEMYDIFAYGRFLQATLGRSRWREFREQAERRVRAVCSELIEYTGCYHLALGDKPRS